MKFPTDTNYSSKPQAFHVNRGFVSPLSGIAAGDSFLMENGKINFQFSILN
jgi:hypothetical protein